jgi:hypothetical protein
MDEIDDISQCAPVVAGPCGSSSPAARVVAALPVDHQIERLFSDAHNDLMIRVRMIRLRVAGVAPRLSQAPTARRSPR